MSLEYTYTKTNLLDNVRDVVDNRVIEKYTYDNNGNVLSKDVPSSKQRTMYTYNAAGR